MIMRCKATRRNQTAAYIRTNLFPRTASAWRDKRGQTEPALSCLSVERRVNPWRPSIAGLHRFWQEWSCATTAPRLHKHNTSSMYRLPQIENEVSCLLKLIPMLHVCFHSKWNKSSVIYFRTDFCLIIIVFLSRRITGEKTITQSAGSRGGST